MAQKEEIDMADTIAAIGSGKIPCAIGILRLSGDHCAQIANQVFTLQAGIPIWDAPNRKLMIGTLQDVQGRVIDQALMVYTRAPHTYTGEDTVELQCHGSPAVLAAGLEALFAAGARQALPGEFTKRAFLNGQMDLTQAEAFIDLIDAETTDAAANAAGQVGGALIRKLEPIYQSLVDLCSHFHAVLDYPDEDIADFQLENFTGVLEDNKAQLTRMLDTCAHGQYLKRGVQTVLLGKPNVGKSSLLNALAGFDRVIVTEIPGTTRDTVEESVLCGGVLLRLTDTAGIRDTEDAVERLGVERSRKAVEAADLVLAVVDGSVPMTEEDREVLRLATRAPRWIAVFSKCDLWDTKARSVGVIGQENAPAASVSLSAVTGEGLDRLEAAVAELFPAGEAPDSGSLLTDQRQEEAAARARDAIRRAREALDAGLTPDAILTDAEEALDALGELTGRTAKEEIVSRIFSRFCVGK